MCEHSAKIGDRLNMAVLAESARCATHHPHPPSWLQCGSAGARSVMAQTRNIVTTAQKTTAARIHTR